MPLQNRVGPDGEIEAVAARGTMMGNRGGCIHTDDRRLKTRHWANDRWICCRLTFKERRRVVMSPGRYTELFFLDEATALAAGHRPCFECRRADAEHFRSLWPSPQLRSAPEMDVVLHTERLTPASTKKTWTCRQEQLPAGTMIRDDAGLCLLTGNGLMLTWSHQGYSNARPVQGETTAEVLTPPSIVAILLAGYRPMLHPTAANLIASPTCGPLP
jgi:hypothetical protein